MSEATDDTKEAGGEQESATPAQPQRPAIELDTTDTMAAYANFCRVTGTPEELIVDFGLNPQPIGPNQTPVKISQRIILNYYTAKRLLGALSISIQRHEGAFGVLKTDVNKRVQAPPQAS